MSTALIAITGGIGSGKSVVSRVLRAMGYPVFDCDSEAKAIMDADTGIHRRLCQEIHPAVVTDGLIDRRLLGEIVFNDSTRLAALNSIVHTAVKAHLAHWSESQSGPAFVETAILFESGLNASVDAEWRVESPLELRIERVMKRNGLTREQVEARIASQSRQPENPPLPPRTVLVNDLTTALLPQIRSALHKLTGN